MSKQPVDLDEAIRLVEDEDDGDGFREGNLARALSLAVAELREHRERNRPNWHRLDFPPPTSEQVAAMKRRASWSRTEIYDSVLLDSGVDIQPSNNVHPSIDQMLICARPQRNNMRVEFIVAALDALDGFTIDEWRVGNIGHYHPVIFANRPVVGTAQDIVVIVRRTANTPGRFCVRVAGETVP